jgi:hypothetical protein
MNRTLGSLLVVIAAVGFAPAAAGEPKSVNPAVRQIVDEISEERIAETLKKLESFGTRNTMSPGALAARQWIYEQFKSYSPRLEVRFDSYKVRKQRRVPHDIEMANVVAVLPGTVHPERQFLVGGHYDSLAITGEDWILKQAEAVAPGVDDDGSGTAAVMELARVMSRREFEQTLVFVAFVGEEQGLLGSALYANKARGENQIIDGVLSNDIIGTAVGGTGRVENGEVHVYSASPEDSPFRELARSIQEIGERYVPSMKVDLVFRSDRFGRGGDHTPFAQEGYAAVRFTTANENYSHQHSAEDVFANVSVPYVARVAKINAAVLANLALAPPAPVVAAGTAPLLGRGKSGYDAVLKWQDDHPAADLAGYIVRIRSTAAPYWEREIFVGKVTEFVLENVSIDDRVFGVQAVDRDGNESLVSTYVLTPYPRKPPETY